MPSTGTAGFTITRDGLINTVLRGPLRVLIEGSTATAQQLLDASNELNILLKKWTTGGLKLWTYMQVLVPTSANKQTYTIGPTGADVTSVRPLRVFETGNFIRQTINSLPYDTPLNLLSRAEYDQLGAKGSAGVPNSIYYHPGIDLASGLTSPSTGYGTLYVYVTASPNITRTIYLNAQRPIYDMTSGTDEFDLPAEWFEAVKWGLARQLVDYYELPEPRITRITQEAMLALKECEDWSTEEAAFRVAPNMQGRRRYR